MKLLISFLILTLINFSLGDNAYELKGRIERYSYQKVYYSGSCFYLKGSDFPDVNFTEIKVSVYDGYFTENSMYFGLDDELYDIGDILRFTLGFDSISNSSKGYDGYKYYKEFIMLLLY